LFENDPAYREKAAKIAAMTRDISEVLLTLGAEAIQNKAFSGELNISKVNEHVKLKRRELRQHKRSGHREDAIDSLSSADHPVSEGLQSSPGPLVAFHPPCSLQHGQKLGGQIESLLQDLGFTLTTFEDSQECIA